MYWEARPKENHWENRGVFSPDFPQNSPQGSLEITFFPQGFWGELWGKSWLKTPIFPMVSFGLGGLGPKFPNFIGRTPPGHQKFGDLPRPFRTQIPKIHWEEAATQATQAKGNHGETGGGFQPRFSTELSPRNFGNRNFGNKESAGLKTLNLPCGFL